jgi:primase-polymerase (primpol)-like protein
MTEFQIPDGLRELDQWLLWRKERVNDRDAKVPYGVHGRRASVVEAGDLSPFDEAMEAWKQHRARYQGVGFVFLAGGGLVGVDLDDSLDSSGRVKPWARGIVERFADSYCEISPSGAGLKIWCRAELPANLPGVRVGDGSIEMYSHARYFTVTGRVFRGAPLQVEEHAADVLHMYERLTSGKVKSWPLQPLNGGRIPAGQQHSTLVSIAGTLRARRVCDQAILACLLAINEHQCERPGPVENIARIVSSSRAWGAR